MDNKLPLGKTVNYPNAYDPQLLKSVPRNLNRAKLGILGNLPFTFGEDYWTAFELSWLNAKGMPQVGIGKFSFYYQSPFLIESKSLKLYLNSLNQKCFDSVEDLQKTLMQDLSECVDNDVVVKVIPLHKFAEENSVELKGELIDHQDLEISHYSFNRELLADCTEGEEVVEEFLLSHLLKSNCLITSQPDWGSVQIHYVGRKINREKLLRYLISFRTHHEFHEQCVERIFCDLMHFAKPDKLTVYVRYNRRGGLDINPYRSNFERPAENINLPRQ